MSASYSFRRDAIVKALFKAVQGAVAETAITFQDQVRKQLSRSGSTRARGNVPSAPGTPPGVQTGHLRRSFQSANSPGAYFDRSQFANPTLPTLKVGTRVKYAAIHEYGGVITAKGKSLAVPIHPDAHGKSPRDFDLFMVKRPGKPPLLYRRRSGSGSRGRGTIVEEPMFVLVKSVRIPARPYVRPARNATAKLINGIVDKHLRKAIARVAGGRV